MTAVKFDIDIDLPAHVDKSVFGVRAIQYLPEKKSIKPHPSGYYISGEMPKDPFTGMATVDYEDAQLLGLTKVDLLTNTAMSLFSDKADYLRCLSMEPRWDQLLNPEVTSQLPHLANHHDVLAEVRPTSIAELADVLAMIRPSKRHWVSSYRANPFFARQQLYVKPKEGMYFKRSHAIAYAQMIVAVLNKLDGFRLIQF